MTPRLTLDSVKSELDSLKAVIGDLNAEDLKGLIEEKKNSEIKELEDKKEYSRIVERMKTEHESVVSGLQNRIDELTQELSKRDSTIESVTVGRCFSESEFIQKDSVLPPSIARKEFGAYFDLVDGQVVGFDKPRGAEGRTMIVDATGEPKPFNDAIQELYKSHPDYKALVWDKRKAGAGSKSEISPGTKSKASKSTGRGRARIAAGLLSKDR